MYLGSVHRISRPVPPPLPKGRRQGRQCAGRKQTGVWWVVRNEAQIDRSKGDKKARVSQSVGQSGRARDQDRDRRSVWHPSPCTCTVLYCTVHAPRDRDEAAARQHPRGVPCWSWRDGLVDVVGTWGLDRFGSIDAFWRRSSRETEESFPMTERSSSALLEKFFARHGGSNDRQKIDSPQ